MSDDVSIRLPRQVNVRLDSNLFDRLMTEVKKWRTTKSAILREAVIRELRRRDRGS